MPKARSGPGAPAGGYNREAFAPGGHQQQLCGQAGWHDGSQGRPGGPGVQQTSHRIWGQVERLGGNDSSSGASQSICADVVFHSDTSSGASSVSSGARHSERSDGEANYPFFNNQLRQARRQGDGEAFVQSVMDASSRRTSGPNSSYGPGPGPVAAASLPPSDSNASLAAIAERADSSEYTAAAPVPDDIWTVGGRFHEMGECTPCRFFTSRVGCNNGQHCEGCHHPHKKSARPCGARRTRYHNRLKKFDEVQEGSAEFVELVNELSSKGTYMKKLVSNKVKTEFPDAADNVPGSSASSTALPRAYPMSVSL